MLKLKFRKDVDGSVTARQYDAEQESQSAVSNAAPINDIENFDVLAAPEYEAGQESQPEVEFLQQEVTFENVEVFVRQRGRASCSDLKKAFKISRVEAVHLMDALEYRGVIAPIPLRADGVPVSAGARLVLA